MDDSTIEKVKKIETRFKEVELLMAEPETASNIPKITKLAKEHSDLKLIVNLYQTLIFKNNQFEDTKMLISEESDQEILDLAKKDYDELSSEISSITQELESQLIPKDIRDKADAIIEIRAGTGGD